MTRPFSSTTEQLKPPEERNESFAFDQIQDGRLEVQDLTHGLDTSNSREKVAPGGARELTNARNRSKFFGRRPGHSILGLAADGTKAMGLYGATITRDRNMVVKYSETSIQVLTSTLQAWKTVTGDLYSAFNRVSSAQFLDDVYSATLERGILRIELAGFTSLEVEGAPTAKFITNFADRIVAAHIRDPSFGLNSSKIQWSANGDPLEWDPNEDDSSGFEDLLSSPSDTGDEITGLFSVGQNLAILLRERSIWHITRQPFAIAPFRFNPIITDVGCDLPYSAVRVPGGIIFADTRTNGVYFYQPGAIPQRINQKVENVIFANLDRRDDCEGMWDPTEREYCLGIATDRNNRGRMDERFIWNFDTKGWVKDDRPRISAMAAVRDPGAAITIDELLGTIDALIGTIDDLAQRSVTDYIVIKNFDFVVNPDSVQKEDTTSATELGDAFGQVRFTMTYEPIEQSSVRSRRSLKLLLLVHEIDDSDIEGAPVNASATLFVAKNDEAFVAKKTLDDLIAENRNKIGVKRPISGDRIRWKLETTYKNYELREWFIKILQKGVKKLDTVQS